MRSLRLERCPLLYRVSHWFLGGILQIVYGLWEEGAENIPVEGGCIIASNHISLLDPPVLGSAIPHRQVHFMAKKELFRIPILGPLLPVAGTFPVARGAGDRRAMNRAVELLQQGRVVGMYPEGTRSRDGRLGQGQVGVAMLACRAGVPVVPAAVFGTDIALHQRKLVPGGPPCGVRFGEPIAVFLNPEPGRQELARVRDDIMAGIQALLEVGPPEPARRSRPVRGREDS